MVFQIYSCHYHITNTYICISKNKKKQPKHYFLRYHQCTQSTIELPITKYIAKVGIKTLLKAVLTLHAEKGRHFTAHDKNSESKLIFLNLFITTKLLPLVRYNFTSCFCFGIRTHAPTSQGS